MSARDKDARAAMDTILYSVLTGDTDPMTPADVAHDAWGYADAMAAERAKRDQADATAVRDELPGEEHIGAGASPSRGARRDAELDAARREGRDAGLRAVADECEQAIRDPELNSGNIPGLRLAIRMAARLSESPLAAPPKVKADDSVLSIALASENAKLRAVAAESALICRGIGGMERLQGALEAAGFTMVAHWRDEAARRDTVWSVQAAELTKLLAVADAAARRQRWRQDGGSTSEGMTADRELTAALDAWAGGWRTK